MNQWWDIHPLLRAALVCIGLLAIAGLLTRWIHHRHQPPEATTLSASSTPSEAEAVAQAAVSPQAGAPPHLSTNRILADCQPHLGDVSISVPNIDVSDRPNPAAVQMKVRFWVNGDGFVTQVFVTGANVVVPAWTQGNRAGLRAASHLRSAEHRRVPNPTNGNDRHLPRVEGFER